MTSIIPSNYLKIQEYASKLGLNPDNSKYKFISADNPTTTNSQFKIFSPSSRSLLYAFCLWEIKIRVTAIVNNVVPIAHLTNAAHVLALKPFLPMQGNCVTNMNLNWNGYNSNMRPQDFVELLGLMFAGREGSKSLSMGGGEFSDYNQIDVGSALAAQNHFAANFHFNVDPATFKKWGKLASIIEPLKGTSSTFLINWFEPLIIPPFNPFCEFKNELPDYCWFKKMTTMIPFFDNITLNIDYQKMETCLENFRDQAAAAPNANAAVEWRVDPAYEGLVSKLHMWWFEPPKNVSTPSKYILQTWWSDKQEEDLGILNTMATASKSVNNIRLSTTPTLITVHFGRTKTHASYGCGPNNLKATLTTGGSGNSTNQMLTMSNLIVDISTKDRTINETLTQAEMYHMTRKNSKSHDFPFTYSQYLDKMFIALRPEDMSQDFPSGVNDNITLDITATYLQNSLSVANSYKMIVTMYYGENFIVVTPHENTEKKVNIPLNVAKEILYSREVIAPTGQTSYTSSL
jgi:hypothetical protein